MDKESKAPMSDLLGFELNRGYSRDEISLAAATTADLPRGTVLALEGAALTAATTASAAVVLLEDAPLGATSLAVVARGAIVNSTALIWPSGATDEEIAAGVGALEARGLVAREFVAK